MKSTVEKLSPTRVRINVEVPFAELQADFDRAYKQLAQQVRLPGFRPGKAPAKLLEARVGRAAVLEQVVNDALPARYSEAVATGELRPLGQPDIEVTKIEDGEELVFTAEVDVRPDIDLPDLGELKISVEPIEISDTEVEAELDGLRARFGTLKSVERPAQTGDFVSIDLAAAVDGEDVPDGKTEGLSHEIGSGQLIDGLDEAIVGLRDGESATFTTKLLAGEHAGQDADVTVTVKSIKERELPEPDDEFAQLASEFDTVTQLRENLTEQVRRVKRIHQAEKIRDQALETLLELVEVPLPQAIVAAQVDSALHNAIHPLDHDEAKFAEALEGADEVFVLDVYAAREQPLAGVSGATIAGHVGVPVHYVPDFSAVAGQVAAAAMPGDVVVTMGAGDVTLLGREIIAALRVKADARGPDRGSAGD